ncbi:aminotransferase class III-fold pyridoxal phosphate-dependent enzyme [Mycobacterium sp. 21AC1]|uniref:aminotransferase family protein n=1 Tax=[Mycobacterium] appelbergii TaxID=2939269 RepID=UPI002938F6D6|nr:aminotransferase class III-fold pyridoxal phosphate-dependent enzyme [Mycobacterium sp. 21AC1]MDV3128956.1 aminotransferase class III-fold pyridoxal phosphate-dependent enzyme [Mycobacterium sp. 21AC1]
MVDRSFVTADETNVFIRELDRSYPLIERGEGMWLYDTAGNAYLDGVSGGAMVTSLGHGAVPEILKAVADQTKAISFLYNVHATTPAQERLARDLTSIAPDGFNRVHFVSGGTEANELALRMVRSYHVERGDEKRHLVVSPAQAYHGASVATFGLTGRPGLQAPYQPYIQQQPHIPPSTWLFDPTGQSALAALDEILDRDGERVAAFLIEPVSAASLPGYSPPEAFWRGLDERRRKHGFLVWFDEVVTGLGRTGTWFAADQMPIRPDVITTAKGLGAGFFPVGAMLVADHVYQAVANGSRSFEPGHTWDGAPLSCAVGSAVIAHLKRTGLVDTVRERGPWLLGELRRALEDCEMVREVRGRGFLLGVSYVDPRDGSQLLDPALQVAGRIDEEALQRLLLIYSTQPTRDGFAGDQTLLSPAFIATDTELEELVERFAASVKSVEAYVKAQSVGATR